MYPLALDERLRGVLLRFMGTQITPLTLNSVAYEIESLLLSVQAQEPTFPPDRHNTRVTINVLEDNELLVVFTPETRRWLEENI